MSNEPNEAEKKLAREITLDLFANEHPKMTIAEFIDIIAPILAAHRADEGELAKALKELLDTWSDEYLTQTSETVFDFRDQLRAALARHAPEGAK